jgi:hypothetical protein
MPTAMCRWFLPRKNEPRAPDAKAAKFLNNPFALFRGQRAKSNLQLSASNLKL